MAKNKIEKKSEELAALNRIKKLAVMAMFSDDELLDELVLKGGNATALIHKLTSRESVDLDFSMKHDFPDGVEAMTSRINAALLRIFRPAGYEPFDLMSARTWRPSGAATRSNSSSSRSISSPRTKTVTNSCAAKP